VVGNTMRAPSRYRAPRRRWRRPYRRPAPYVYYGSRPRYRPVTIIVDHHLVYDRINRAERRMARLEGRVTRLNSWQAHRDLEQDARDMRGELAAIDRSSNRIRSWHHWEATQNRLHRLRWRLDGLQEDLAVGPQPTQVVRTAPVGVNAMSSNAFAKVEYEMQAASFRDDKLRVVRRVARDHWLTSAQARAMVRYVHHAEDKIEARVILEQRVVDPENM
jgi:hypothetical protein